MSSSFPKALEEAEKFSEPRSQGDVESSSLTSKTKGEETDVCDDTFRVTLDPSEDPTQWSVVWRWFLAFLVTFAGFCSTFASSAASFTEDGLVEDLHTSHEVSILSISLYVLGMGLGPLLVGPLSEVYGRNIIYQVSYVLFFAFTWPTAFPPDMATFLVFRFISGFCSSAFLSVAGGSVGDLFAGAEVASPMAMYALGPFLGPAMGPMISAIICQHIDWRWTYRLLLIMQFSIIILLFTVIPETYEPALLKRKAARLRKETGNSEYWAPLDRQTWSLSEKILSSCSTPFKLLLFDHMVLLLDTWSALILGILYLTFEAYPIIFQGLHGFNMQDTGLSFLGIAIGLTAATLTQPFWNRFIQKQAAKYDGKPPPEVQLIRGQVGGVIAPIGLFWLAFTTYRSVPWIVPIIASVLFGFGSYYMFTSTFTYLVIAYRPVAASALASNTAWRLTFAAIFPLFANQMYNRLGTVGATALLAGLLTLMMPLPFFIYRMGARLRKNSPYSVAS
ncbi:uncharacterized protein FIBRA_02917 [Fibroporia radiculosa]|uniref:Major facilitator superfamily (MFS) profile domain-containing protein n=1 Tax=Fibroporia radiculosa TaxID=599839 RepID=J4I9B5_9APHY|nr:uncharacterized protein FIBRA_02917 [Fibroporia radiculosa]CCM00871.1 predicted protein [Fibroporia radiculosa]